MNIGRSMKKEKFKIGDKIYFKLDYIEQILCGIIIKGNKSFLAIKWRDASISDPENFKDIKPWNKKEIALLKLRGYKYYDKTRNI